MKRLLQERERNLIMNILKRLHEYREDSSIRAFMSPFVGIDIEIDSCELKQKMASGGRKRWIIRTFDTAGEFILDSKSVPRASDARPKELLRQSRSLPLAVLIRQQYQIS
jgi:hypothetical protein